MAHVYRNGKKWRAQINRNGVRVSQTFETKSAATQWAAAEETEIRSVKRGGLPKKTFAQALERYRDEESPKKKGGSWEVKRINALIRDFPDLTKKQLTAVNSADLAQWRDTRLKGREGEKPLKAITKGSVQRDVNVFSNVFTIARDEWKWCKESPFTGFRAPGENPPRVRRIQLLEVKKLLRRLGHRSGQTPETKSQEVALAFMISLRTAMRAGEVMALTKARIDVEQRVARVPHKTEHLTLRAKEVPLSKRTLLLLKPIIDGWAWTINSARLDGLFRKARDSVLISDLHFHDARAYALTQFAKKVNVMQLARISGHKDLRTLMDHYYRVTPAEIAAKLD